jgi:RNA-directed DNA polymerase
MRIKLKELISKMKRHPTPKNINLYNSTVLGFHDYYNSATDCSIDFKKLGYILSRFTYNRLKSFSSSVGKPSDTLTRK